MQVIVDEGIGESAPLWQQWQAWLGDRSAEIVWLATRYPAMPDVELLDKLLTPDTVLLTRDGVLHNRALAGAWPEAHVPFADPRPCSQFGWVVVQGDLRVGEHHQQARLSWYASWQSARPGRRSP